MGSLDGLNYGAFAPHLVNNGPNILDYFNQGQQAVQSVVDQQYQAQVRQNLLAQQQRQAQMDALLGPIKVEQGNADVAATQAGTASTVQRTSQSGQLFPYQLQDAQVGAQYAGANAANQNVLNRIAVTQGLRGIGPTTLQNPDGSSSVVRPGLALGGYGLPDNSGIATNGDLPGGSSPANPSSLTSTVRTTTYGINDSQSDPDTAAGRTSTGAPVIPASPTMAGTAAVDPTKIPYGSIIHLKDGSTYVAGDTGGAVKAQTASQGQAPVIDLVGKPGSVADWNDVTISPPTADYVHLSSAQKLAYHQAAARNPVSAPTGAAAMASDAQSLPANNFLVSNDGGALDRAIAQMTPQADPRTVAPVVTSVPGANLVNPTPIGQAYNPFPPISTPTPAVSVSAPISSPGIGMSLPIPLYKPVSSAYDKNTLISQPNPEADKVIESARLGQTDPTPFIHQGANGNGYVDMAGLEAAQAQKAQGLTISRLQNEYQSNKPIQSFLKIAGNNKSIQENLAIPADQRTAADDDALEKAVAGIENPEGKPSEAELKALKSTAGIGDKWAADLSGVPGLDRLPGVASLRPRLLSNEQVQNLASVAQRKVDSLQPVFQGQIGQLSTQAQNLNIDPSKIFDPQTMSLYQSQATPRPVASPVLNGSVRVRLPDGRIGNLPQSQLQSALAAGATQL